MHRLLSIIWLMSLGVAFFTATITTIITTTMAAAAAAQEDAYIASIYAEEEQEIIDAIFWEVSNLSRENVVALEDLFKSLRKPEYFAFEYYKRHDIPFLHHALNAYYVSRDPLIQQSIVIFLSKILDLVDLSIDLPYKNDPHILLKLLLMREIILASKVAKRSKIFSTTTTTTSQSKSSGVAFESLLQVYSVVCEPVPLTKLFLAGDSFVRSKPNKQLSFPGGIEGVKRLLASANPGNTKPSVKMHELLNINSTNNLKIIENLGYDSGNMIKLEDIFLTLGDVSNHIHKEILRTWKQQILLQNVDNVENKTAASWTDSQTKALDAFALLFAREDAKNRNLFHFLAQGSMKIIDDIHEFLCSLLLDMSESTAAIPEDVVLSFKQKVKLAMISMDYRQMKPIEYTIVRFGSRKSNYFKSVEKLYRLFFTESEVESLVINSPKRSLSSSSSSSSSAAAAAAAASFGVDGSEDSDDASVVGMTKQQEREKVESRQQLTEVDIDGRTSTSTSTPIDIAGVRTDDASGGWDSSYFNISYIEPQMNSKLNDNNYCDIVEVHVDADGGGFPSSSEFFEKYVRTGTPVIFRNAMPINHPLRSAFEKSNFVAKYGKEIVPIATIPYAATFGFKSTTVTLAEVANMTSFESQSELNQKLAAGIPVDTDNLPLYAFSVANPQWSSKLRKDARVPDFLVGAMYSGSQPIDGDNVEIQFYLGPAGSGAPVHFHGHAANSLAFGEKKWFLYPPEDAFYSTLPALSFLSTHPLLKSALICTQKAGDIIYVPSLFGHSTMNMKQTIGVAHEFSIETFCME